MVIVEHFFLHFTDLTLDSLPLLLKRSKSVDFVLNALYSGALFAVTFDVLDLIDKNGFDSDVQSVIFKVAVFIAL